MNRWLLKTEPGAYSWDDLVREGRTAWTGVANPQAQSNLRSMRAGDVAVVYHTGAVKAAVGLAVVVRAAYPEPGAGGLSCVDLAPEARLAAPVGLAALKVERAFAGSPLVRQGRLSVVPIDDAQWSVLLALSVKGPPARPARRDRPADRRPRGKAVKPATRRKASPRRRPTRG